MGSTARWDPQPDGIDSLMGSTARWDPQPGGIRNATLTQSPLNGGVLMTLQVCEVCDDCLSGAIHR